jgi:hypothetical protein
VGCGLVVGRFLDCVRIDQSAVEIENHRADHDGLDAFT